MENKTNGNGCVQFSKIECIVNLLNKKEGGIYKTFKRKRGTIRMRHHWQDSGDGRFDMSIFTKIGNMPIEIILNQHCMKQMLSDREDIKKIRFRTNELSNYTPPKLHVKKKLMAQYNGD